MVFLYLILHIAIGLSLGFATAWGLRKQQQNIGGSLKIYALYALLFCGVLACCAVIAKLGKHPDIGDSETLLGTALAVVGYFIAFFVYKKRA